MRAIRVTAFGGPEVLTLADVADPQPGPGQIRVRVHAAGVNPVDAYIRSGTYASKPPLPYTPGSDAAGLAVIATAGTARGLALVAEVGAHHAVDHSQPDYRAAIKAAAGGRGPDVVLEMLANVNLAHDAELLAPRGRIVVIGSRGSLDF